MSIWGLIQVVMDIFLFVGLFVCIVRSPRTSKDDPRISRALQLLQSKISVLEDLSDKTDVQFQKITNLVEQKVLEVQQAITNAERQLQSLKEATAKGIETTRLVQTGLGAEQVIERHTNEVYAKAAQLAFEGKSIEEICEKLDLSQAEVELIVKFNRDSLRTVASQAAAAPAPQKPVTQDYGHLFDVPNFDASSLNKIGEEFRRVTREFENTKQPEAPVLIPPSFQEQTLSFEEEVEPQVQLQPKAQPQSPTKVASPRLGTQARELNSAPVVKKVIFPRIEKS